MTLMFQGLRKIPSMEMIALDLATSCSPRGQDLTIETHLLPEQFSDSL